MVLFGYKASAEQFTPRELIEYSVFAEECGFDSAMVSDHFQPWRHTGGHAPFSLTWLAAVGERTKKIILGTSVLTPTFRYNPAIIAQAFGSLGCLYPDRILLGVGTGEALNEYACGFQGQWPEFKERLARLKEAISLIRALWTGQEVEFQGTYYRSTPTFLYDVPDNPVPIFVAAGGPQMAKVTGRIADGFICTSGKGKELYVDKLLPALAEGITRRDDQISRIPKMIEIKVSYDRDKQQAAENMRFWSPLSLNAEQKHSVSSAQEMEALADALPIETIARRWIMGCDPEEVAAAINEYIDYGFDHLVFHGPGHDQKRFLSQFSDDVLPLLHR